MESMEEAFREGLRDAVSNQPAMAPVELDGVLARAARPAAGGRPVGRWIGLAAAVTLAAGLGVWAVQSSARVPAEPRVAGTPAGGQVRTLRVLNDTDTTYRQAAVQLVDGRILPLGDVPAGGAVLVPMDGTATAPASISIDTSTATSGLRVIYSGDCSTSAGHQITVVTDQPGVTIQIAGPSGESTADGSSIVSATIVPANPSGTPSPGSVPDPTYPAPEAGPTSAVPTAAAPVCTITIAEVGATPETTHS